MARGEGSSLRSLEKFCAEKRQIVPICSVLVELRWRYLSGLGCDEIQNFNTTNVVLNLILLATLSVKVAGGEGGSLRRKMKKYPGLRCSS